MLPVSHLTLAYPYGEMEKLRPGEARGLCWEHMVVAAHSVKSRPEHFVLICCSVACLCAYTHVCSRMRTCVHAHTHTPTSKTLKAVTWQRDVSASKEPLLILSFSVLVAFALEEGGQGFLLCPI